MLVQAQLLHGEHIVLIFVQCWVKTSLHSFGHRGCHCKMAATGKASQPSESNPRPRAAARHCGTISKVEPCGGAHCCIFVILVCSSFSIFWLCIYSDMILNIQAKERVCCIFCITHLFDKNLHFFGEFLATSLRVALELEKPQTAR